LATVYNDSRDRHQAHALRGRLTSTLVHTRQELRISAHHLASPIFLQSSLYHRCSGIPSKPALSNPAHRRKLYVSISSQSTQRKKANAKHHDVILEMTGCKQTKKDEQWNRNVLQRFGLNQDGRSFC
jgi:hypothetical protein